MAATLIRAPAYSLSHQTMRKASFTGHSGRVATDARSRSSFDTVQRVSLSTMVSIEGDDYNTGENKKRERTKLQLWNYVPFSRTRLAMSLLPEIRNCIRVRACPLSASDLSNSVKNGSRIRVAYQGVRGAYSESAAEKAYPNCEAVNCEQFDIAFQVVEQCLVDRAILPIENSLGGSIHRNYDLLLRHRLHIVGEVQLPIRHCLLANHGVRVEDLTRVLSHPQALAQCENTLTKLGVITEAVDNTAVAAQFVALHKLKGTAAVASFGAASIYNLNVLAQDIQDDPDNITRFLMLAREPVIPGTDKPFKTSIVFSLEEGPGVLFKALAVFATRNINLTKIESRPRRKRPLRQGVESTNGSPKEVQMRHFDYLFYVDFEASMADPNSQNALRDLKEFTTFLRLLGSYPMDINLA